MASPDNRIVVSRLRLRALRVLFASAGGGLVLALVIFLGVGRWLVVEDPLTKVRAIVVLSGAMPVRAMIKHFRHEFEALIPGYVPKAPVKA